MAINTARVHPTELKRASFVRPPLPPNIMFNFPYNSWLLEADEEDVIINSELPLPLAAHFILCKLNSVTNEFNFILSDYSKA